MEPDTATTTSRRLRTLVCSFELVREFLTAGDHAHIYVVSKDAIPADAVLVNVRHAWPNCVELLIHSAEFAEVPEYGIPEPLTPIFT